MLRHQGRSRTDRHNLQLAALFSFVAGLVNIGGLLAVRQLTTNITGHFAYFAEGVTYHNIPMAINYGVFIIAFFAGAFVSSTLMELADRYSSVYIYVLPVGLEILILLSVALASLKAVLAFNHLFAGALLFAMGLQNALVTTVSNAAVRTTHLTGLFTDIGIELSQLMFYRKREQRQSLTISLRLRGTIVLCFFAGCIVGGLIYPSLQLHIFLLAVVCLTVALSKDIIRLKLIIMRRKFR